MRIDGASVRNEERRSHKEWYWCGKVLNGNPKTFAREFNDDEAPIRIEIRADETPVIDAVNVRIKKKPFTDKDVKSYIYKGRKGNEDYNRFNNEILNAVNRWNQEFDDAYPPPEPLHPDLVKAMIYIESRMGYFESRGYPLYPDVRKNTIKLWSIGLLLALTLVGGGLGVYAYENNGYFWLSFDEIQEEGAEYVLVLNEIRGIITRKTPIAIRYSNGQNFYDIKKSDEVTFHGHDLNYDGEPEIVITGRSKYGLTVYALQNVNGVWTIIPRIGDPHGSQYSAPAFHGHDVNFANTDGEGWKEAKESTYISHTNARGGVQGEVWHTWYRYDPKIRAFVFMEQNIETVKKGVDPWEETFGDSIMIEKSPNFIW